MFDGSGWWVIFPIIGLVFMLLMMSRMLGFWSRGPGRGTGPRPMRMGPMFMMGEREPDRTGDLDAIDVLRRRYAAGELADEEFDAMRRKLEDR